MIIETFIDTRDLGNKQSLIIIDEQGRRWDVEEALNSSPESAEDSGHASNAEVVLERWVVQLGEPPKDVPRDIAPILPRTYKNSIVLFRSLYACARLLPAWKLGRKLFSPRPSPTVPRLRYRISQGQDLDSRNKIDPLSVPLYVGHENVLEKFAFDPIDSPAGAISMHATYRSNCDFRIDNSEEFLSSRFMGMDERSFEPSLGRQREPTRREVHHRTISADVGSLPQQRPEFERPPDPGQAYGSMSTFHQLGPPLATSPLSALRAAQVAGSASPDDSALRKVPSNLRSTQGSRSSLRSADGGPGAGVGRRPSVSFMPFKTPALSASPLQNEPAATSIPRGSLSKNSPLATLAEARNPHHIRPTSRDSPTGIELGIPPMIADSPKPPAPTRFSSSFGHRKGKLSAGGGSKTEDDTSSGKASVISSSAQPGSGMLAEGETSSGSLQTDDDNISDFLKLLDQKKDLRSFRPTDDNAGGEGSARRMSTTLHRFQRMRDSNMALSESMSSSLMLHRSSTSSSQKISSVPAMVAGTSMSVSTSPGKPISPHTPHTPAIPSRLSANSVAEYPGEPDGIGEVRDVDTEHEDSQIGVEDPPTGPIDIPNSPRPYHPSCRRSSSAAQRRAVPPEDEDIFPFGMRSASLGVHDDRPPLSLSALATYQGGASQGENEASGSAAEHQESLFGPMFDTSEASSEPGRRDILGGQEESASTRTRGGSLRPRTGRVGSRGDNALQDSSSTHGDRGSGSGISGQRGGRYHASRPASHFEEEEPLFFAMSDFGATQQSRRSLDEGRVVADSTSSSRRGSRRGGF